MCTIAYASVHAKMNKMRLSPTPESRKPGTVCWAKYLEGDIFIAVSSANDATACVTTYARKPVLPVTPRMPMPMAVIAANMPRTKPTDWLFLRAATGETYRGAAVTPAAAGFEPIHDNDASRHLLSEICESSWSNHS